MENAPFEVGNLLAWIQFAKVSEVVQAHKVTCSLTHGFNVQPAFSPPLAMSWVSWKPLRAGHRCKGGLGEEVPVAALSTEEAGAEIDGRVGTPGKDSNVFG